MATGIVSTVLIEDVLLEASPDLEDAPSGYLRSLTALLEPAINKLVMNCASPESMASSVNQQRQFLSSNIIAAQAFEIFLRNMTET